MIFRLNKIFLICVGLLLVSCSEDSQYNTSQVGNNTATTPSPVVIATNAPDISSSSNTINGSLGTAIATWTPTNSSTDPVDSWSIVPAVFCGLDINQTTGTISGTPTCAGEIFFEIKATNSGGTSTKTVVANIDKVSQTIDADIDRSVGINTTTFTQKILTDGAGTGAIIYTISDDSVATIDQNSALVTFVKIGVVTVTATKQADTNYKEANDSYVLTITDDTNPTLSLVHIESNNDKNPNTFAKQNDIVVVKWTANEPLDIATINATISGRVANVSDMGDSDDKTFDATITMASGDSEGNIAFAISSYQDLHGNPGSPVNATTDGSAVMYDRTAPTTTAPDDITIDENEESVVTLVISDANIGNSPYIIDGLILDNIHMKFEQSTNKFMFKTKANFEQPKDSNKDNIYNTSFKIIDKAGNELTKTINITIADVVEPFITRWQVNAGDTITMPLVVTWGINYDIDWGDGGSDTGIATNNFSHTYTSAGTYTVKISRDFPGIKIDNGSQKDKLVSIEQWGDIRLKSMQKSFYGCSALVVNATDAPNLNYAASLFRTFRGATSFNTNINHWDVSRITNMSEMFRDATNFNQDLNSWNIMNVTNSQNMFYGATSFNGNISGWNTVNITNTGSMFRGAASFDQNIKNWNISKVTNSSSMFYGATSFNSDIGEWNTEKITNMNSMFRGATSFDQNLASWDISKVTNITNFLRDTAMGTDNYSDTLIGWSGLTLQLGESFHGGGSKYNSSGQSARDDIINNFGWTINDGGLE